jgi:hypothetical protein
MGLVRSFQGKKEGTAFLRFGLDPDHSAMTFDNLLGEGEADARSRIFLLAGGGLWGQA